MSITKPYTFQAGTKARANEVNSDFDVLYSQVNTNISSIATLNDDVSDLEDTKAEINGSSTQRFAVADAVNSTDAVNKQTFDSSITTVTDLANTAQSTADNKVTSNGAAYAAMPNYGARTGIWSGFVAPGNGYLSIVCKITGNDPQCYVYVDSVQVAHWSRGGDYGDRFRYSCFIPIGKGSTFTYSFSSGSLESGEFIYCKGG